MRYLIGLSLLFIKLKIVKIIGLIVMLWFFTNNLVAQVHTSYLWHMQQPNYWPAKSKENPNTYQKVMESFNLKSSGDSWNVYSDGNSHPLNDLQEIFSKPDRSTAYQHGPKNSVATLTGLPNAGAQVNYSGCLIENVNSLADANQWGYYPGWENSFAEAKSWTTSGGHPRMDMIGFTFHHALSPLISERSLAKEIQAHKYISVATFGGPYSKGYWPAECAFSERIIKVLAQEGIEWSVVANNHLSRTLNDYTTEYGTSAINIDPPNAADKVSTNGNNWWSGQIDGRGGSFAAPYCYQAHKAKYVDPETGVEYKIDVVPMGDLLSYQNGFSSMGTGDIDNHIAPFSDANQPSIVLFAHDGDNAWGGGASYYQESVPNLANEAASKGYMPTTIQQFLSSNPVPENDVVHVEDGAWVNAESDWGHPQFINWLWPLYSITDYRFDPNGWTEDARNWAVITAAENYVLTAEDLDGNVDIADVIAPGQNASNAEKAWHFFLPSLTSGYMYYGKALDMEVKQSIAGNIAIEYAVNEMNAHSGADNTAPSVFIPQRFPYNPGGKGFGPIYGYVETQNSSDFDVWTFAYDVSGLQSVVLKYRTDDDGTNPLSDNVNEVYAGGSGVGDWSSINMTRNAFPKTNVANDPDIDFFELPTAIADLCYAEISGLSNVLLDYYVEATDSKGNVFKTPIQHVFVGEYTSTDLVTLDIDPVSGNNPAAIMVSMNASTTANAASISIYYTTDGSDPDETDNLYTNGFELGVGGESVTVKAIAYDSQGNSSPIVTRSYSFDEIESFEIHFKNTNNWNQVYVYLYNKADGSGLPGWSWPGVAMSKEGTSPWYNYTVSESVESGIVFNNNNNGEQTGDLVRTYDGWYDFSTNTWYDVCPGNCPGGTINSPVLSVNPTGGSFENSIIVYLSATENGSIYYTTDGSAPNQNSTSYSGALTFTETANIKAIAYNSAGNSNVIDETYTKQTIQLPVLTVNPAGGTYTNSVSVALSVTNGGSIYYTTDGSTPTESSIAYNNAIDLGVGTYNLKAKAFNDAGESNLIDENYTVEENQCFTVYFRNTDNWASVNIYLWDKNANSGLSGWSWPGVNMTQIEGTDWYSYEVCQDVEVGIIFNNGSGSQTDNLSRTTEGWFEWSTKQWTNSCPGACPDTNPVPVLSVNPTGGTFASSVSVSLSVTDGGTVHYTTDGSTPSVSSSTYSSSFEFTETTRLRAIAYNSNGSSNTVDEIYTKETAPIGLILHFKKPSHWSNAHLYFWNTTGASLLTGWPGVEMQLEEGDWYKYTLEGVECASIIFNDNGSSQTEDFNNVCQESWYDNGWVSSSSVNGDVALAVQENAKIIELTPYPNPFNNKLSFNVTERSDLKVLIMDMKGRVVFSKELKGQLGKVDLKVDVPKGIYLMQFMLNNGLKTYKIVRE